MAILHEIRIRARYIAPPVLAACMVAYFGYHAVQGDRGLITWMRLQQELKQAQMTKATLAREEARLELRVGLLRPDHLDRDMLEERARAVLGYGREEDFVILIPEPLAAPRGGSR